MNFQLRFHSAIEEDLASNYNWFEQKQLGLGNDFLNEFYSITESIEIRPYLNSILYNNIRRKLMKKFPYAIYYVIQGNFVLIIGVFHFARNPRLIQSSLKDRI